MKKINRGFTLVELLVVIAIIAILAAVVVLIINPLELMKRSRDAARLTDLANLQQAINVAAQESTGSGDVLCSGATVPCSGTSENTAASRNTIGGGWVKVDLSSAKSVSVPTLPTDPLNSEENVYRYCSDGDAWEINAVLESDQQRSKMANDGGDENDLANDAKYEVGSNLSLIGPAGVCTF
jgi:prepilin-type N-terminal cleavage/methylation domain-containing protein